VGGLHAGKENSKKWLGRGRRLLKEAAVVWSSGGGSPTAATRQERVGGPDAAVGWQRPEAGGRGWAVCSGLNRRGEGA
jgi:hypothetical protein